MPEKKPRVRERKAIMIRPEPALLEAMQQAADREGISLNKLALEIIETSGRLGSSRAAGARADLGDAVTEVEKAVRKLRAALE
ncbi:MAG: hypothetical protein V2I66_12560 [Halieaceae bacterium]|jgi:hypothetical protein|nr:hypothetical protein [Halieaceae bacterium]